MIHFLQNFFLKQICNKGTINVLQGGGGSAEYGQRPYFYIFILLDPSLNLKQRDRTERIWKLEST